MTSRLEVPPSSWRAARRRGAHASVAALASLTLGVCVATASEPSSELAGGGLAYVGAPLLVTEREDIVIASGRIRATYIVRNPAAEARTTVVAFALPDIDMLALDGALVETPAFDAQNPGNFVGFSASIDGQPAETFIQASALALGLIDATAVLIANALPLYPLQPDLSERLGALPEAVKSDLLARSLVRPADGQLEPIWSLKSTLFWQQAFAAGQVRTIVANYQPIAGSSPWTPDTAAALRQRYCVPEAAARGLTERAASGEPASVRWVHYLAYAGAQARGPAAQHRMALETAANGKAYTCRDGLNTSAAGARESVLADHVADGEVQVLFVE